MLAPRFFMDERLGVLKLYELHRNFRISFHGPEAPENAVTMRRKKNDTTESRGFGIQLRRLTL
jgi:hypothetical protein